MVQSYMIWSYLYINCLQTRQPAPYKLNCSNLNITLHLNIKKPVKHSRKALKVITVVSDCKQERGRESTIGIVISCFYDDESMRVFMQLYD